MGIDILAAPTGTGAILAVVPANTDMSLPHARKRHRTSSVPPGSKDGDSSDSRDDDHMEQNDADEEGFHIVTHRKQRSTGVPVLIQPKKRDNCFKR